jgi:hypothetical protein
VYTLAIFVYGWWPAQWRNVVQFAVHQILKKRPASALMMLAETKIAGP